MLGEQGFGGTAKLEKGCSLTLMIDAGGLAESGLGSGRAEGARGKHWNTFASRSSVCRGTENPDTACRTRAKTRRMKCHVLLCTRDLCVMYKAILDLFLWRVGSSVRELAGCLVGWVRGRRWGVREISVLYVLSL